MEIAVITLSVVAAVLGALWHFGYLHFGKCQCDEAAFVEHLDQQIDEHSQAQEQSQAQANKLGEVANRAQHLKKLRKKEK